MYCDELFGEASVITASGGFITAMRRVITDSGGLSPPCETLSPTRASLSPPWPKITQNEKAHSKLGALFIFQSEVHRITSIPIRSFRLQIHTVSKSD